MRKDLVNCDLSLLEDVLTNLGYEGRGVHTNWSSAFSEWRNGLYHIIITEKPPNRIVFHIHHDPPYHIGRARVKGEDLKTEYRKIMKDYKRKRSEQIGKNHRLQ